MALAASDRSGHCEAMSKTIVGALPVSELTADSVLRVDATADLWSVASALAAADVGILVVGDGDNVHGRGVRARCRARPRRPSGRR